jgi:hypothetical protein
MHGSQARGLQIIEQSDKEEKEELSKLKEECL